MKIIILVLFIFIALFSQAYGQETSKIRPSASEEKKGPIQKWKGIIRTCKSGLSEKICGKCYCLEVLEGNFIVFNDTKLRGCAAVDFSKVGDLSDLVDKTVNYEGTSVFDTNILCPRFFLLYEVKLLEEEKK
jgi:hypothetical protein